MAWSLLILRSQVDAMAPGRARGSDGTIGDAAHRAGVSDHNPDSGGVVRALDITHDPAGGCDMGVVTEQIRVSRDPRVKYMIFNRRICSSYPVSGRPAWAWGPYSGSSPHTGHGHVSVVGDARADADRPWAIGPAPQEDDVGQLDGVQGEQLNNLERLRQALTSGDTHVRGVYVWTPQGGRYEDQPLGLVQRIAGLEARLAELAARPLGSVTLTEADRASLAEALGEVLGPIALEAAAAAVRGVLGSLDGAVPPGSAR